jgi:hypothetical protein
MKIDEIIVKLEACRDHGPRLHELVYQLARAFREELAALRDYKSSNVRIQKLGWNFHATSGTAITADTAALLDLNPTSGPPTTATNPSISLTFELSQEPELPDQWVGRCIELDISSAGMSPLRALEATAAAVRMIVENYKDAVNTQARIAHIGSELTVVDAITTIAKIVKR